ncbi:MAG: carboxypeptidase regulatory-like domain-containing protein [bacterium]
MALIWPAAAVAQGVGRASGTVRDLDGESIKGATITAENAEAAPRAMTAVTDEKGRFGILGLRRGVWKFTVKAPGYDEVSSPVSIQTLRPNPPMTFTLARTPESEGPMALGRIDLGSLQSKLDVAASFAKTGLLDEAIAAYEGILQIAPPLSSVQLQLGWLYEQKKDTAKALAAYERVIEIGPESPEARRARALIAALKGQS